ncbi:hypothetical protein [Leptothermofonsia sp. ETS-13]|uniref:hypothetical protein n=1 Tax=Leptothermofonsia sp. ETS-13 TaxID=3035696 RepID=UPI003B9F32AA
MKTSNSNPHSQLTIRQILNRVLATGKITRADEMFFLRMLASGASLDEREMDMVSDVLDRLQMGLLKVAD